MVAVVGVAVLVVPTRLFPVRWLGCELSCDDEDDDEEGNDDGGCNGCGVTCGRFDGSVGEDDGTSDVKSLLPTGEKALTYPFEAPIDDDVVPVVFA